MKTLSKAIAIGREIFQTEEQKDALRKAIECLPIDQQKVLLLYFNQQVPVSDISKQMKCSQTTIYQKLNRALFALKNEFNPAVYEKMYNILYPGTGRPAIGK